MLTPRETVAALDKYIIGQNKAKRAVAIALRNRYRRSKLPEELIDEVYPKNIVMMGPTGVGKTEIARRLAKLVDAPFVKVEATKFTEVGYVGRDVDSMVRDLVEVSVRMTKEDRMNAVELLAQGAAQNRLVDMLMAEDAPTPTKKVQSPLQLLMSFGKEPEKPELSEEEKANKETKRESILRDLNAGLLEDTMVDVYMESSQSPMNETLIAMGIDMNVGDVFGEILPKQKKRKRMKVKDARRILIQEEAEKLIDMDEVIREAIERAEQSGIIFIDEIDKIALSQNTSGHDVSREGVQRDILPIVEGCTVNTKYGSVNTDYMLFIAAGAFHTAKISDLIPELQGRFPIHVELDALSKDDFKRILTQPENAVIKQYRALLGADGVTIEFTDDAIDKIAGLALEYNENYENIGARRLHAIMETLLDDISFTAGESDQCETVTIDEEYVQSHVSPNNIIDLHRYIL